MTKNNFSSFLDRLPQNSLSTIIECFIILVFIVLISYLATILYKKIHPQLKRSNRIWDDSLALAIYKPLKYGIWWNGILLIVSIITSYFSVHQLKTLDLIDPLKTIGNVCLIVWACIRFVHELEKNLIKISSWNTQDRLDKTSLRAISQLIRLGVIIVAALILLQTFGIPLSGVIAFGGISGLAISFAAKDLLANFFGGLMIFLDRPFSIGDWVRSPDRNIEGTVEHIGWRLTKIRTFDKRPLYVPNGVLSVICIENPSRMLNRRIKIKIGLRYKDSHKIASILKEIEAMLKSHEEIDQTKTLFVNLINFGHSSLDFLIYTFTKTTNWVQFQKVQQNIFLKALEIIEKNKAQCAYSTTTLDVPDDFFQKINK